MSFDSGIAFGLKKGYPVTKKEKKLRPSQRKGRLGRRVALIRQVVRDVVGFAKYEKKIVEKIKAGHQKKAQKFAKQRLGTLQRAKKKISEIGSIISQQAERDRAAQKKKAAKK